MKFTIKFMLLIMTVFAVFSWIIAHEWRISCSEFLTSLRNGRLFIGSTGDPYIELPTEADNPDAPWRILQFSAGLSIEPPLHVKSERVEYLIGSNTLVNAQQVLDAVVLRLEVLITSSGGKLASPSLFSYPAAGHREALVQGKTDYSIDGITGQLTIRVSKLVDSSFLVIIYANET